MGILIWGMAKVAALRQDYERSSLCKRSDLKEDRVFLEARLQEVNALDEDTTFCSDGLVAAGQEYEKKINAPNTSC